MEEKVTIKLKENGVIRVPIVTHDGKETGEEIIFDLEDFELPFKLNKCKIEHEKNYKQAMKKLDEIEKMELEENIEEGSIATQKELKSLEVMEEFFAKETKALDYFLGEGGTKKMLGGRHPYFSMFDDIDEMLQPVYPLLDKCYEKSIEKIKNKYSEETFKNGKLLK